VLAPATQEAEIRKIVIQSKPGQVIFKTLSRKHPSQKKGRWSCSRCRSRVQASVPRKPKTKPKQKNQKLRSVTIDQEQWLRPVILTIWEAEIRRMEV
jgi:hypothetical protein